MDVLITGGTGFIGQHLARRLVGAGHTVRALVRRTSNRTALEQAGARFVVGDVISGEGLAEAVASADVVVHLAGTTKGLSEGDYFRCNAEGTRQLAHALAQRERPARLVYCSSLSAGGPQVDGRARTERDEPRPVSIYGRSKLAGELAVRQYADRVPTVILRPCIVYGPEDKELLPNLLPMAKLGVFLKNGFGHKRYAMVHVDDVCQAIEAAMVRGQTLRQGAPDAGVYYVSDGHEGYTWDEICAQISRAMGRKSELIVPIPDALSILTGAGSELLARLRGQVPMLNRDKVREMLPDGWTCRIDRAREELAYAPKLPLSAGLPATLDWFRKEGLW